MISMFRREVGGEERVKNLFFLIFLRVRFKKLKTNTCLCVYTYINFRPLPVVTIFYVKVVVSYSSLSTLAPQHTYVRIFSRKKEKRGFV